jgi:hypothetical protein
MFLRHQRRVRLNAKRRRCLRNLGEHSCNLLECFDLATVRRLRLLADQIEQKIQRPSVILTKLTITEGPNDATPA